MSLKIIFMGTPEFSVPALEILLKKKFNIARVYSQPPKKSKRGQKINISPIHAFAESNNLVVKNAKNLNSEEEYSSFKSLSADLGIVVAYGQIIPKRILTTTKLGFLNIHASLLPKWRGAAPIQRAIMNGDKKTGISIMKIIEKLDSGPIILQQELKINSHNTYGQIEKDLSKIGANLLMKSLTKIKNKTANFVEQHHPEATYAKKISKEESKINWNLSADQIIAHIHGLDPKPGAWFKFNNVRYKVWDAKRNNQNEII